MPSIARIAQPLTLSARTADRSLPVLQTAVGDVLRKAASRAADKPGLVAAWPADPVRRRWTFGELLADSERVARALLARFSPGERVAVWAPNQPEWVLLQYGAALAGLTLVTVNPAYRPQELRYVLGQSRAAGVFYVPEYRGSPMAAFLEEVRPRLPELREAISLSDWRSFLDSGSPLQSLPAVRPEDPSQIQYTSGTTGVPKGALLHHRGITNNGRFIAQRLEIQPGETWLNPMPLFHVAGCVINLLGALQTQATQVLCPFDPGLVLELIDAERANTMCFGATMLTMLMEHPDLRRRDVSSLRTLALGGSLIPPELVSRGEEILGVRIAIVFGMTELCGIATQTYLEDTPDDRARTIGQPLPQTEVKIVDPQTGHTLPPGMIGELCVRGYLVMQEYFEMPEATATTIDGDGWLHTGDLGSMDHRGYTRIEGRLKELINRGAEKIWPGEIEDLLLRHPDVAAVAVVGVPDPVYGEQVAAFVRPAAGCSPSQELLFAYCRQHLAPHKTPRYWSFMKQFPMTPSGKIQKFLLREQFVASQGRT
jgi:fatty-acyl-CoA synthase